MDILKEYFTGNCSISLENIAYEKLGELEEDVSLVVEDNIDIKNYDSYSGSIEFIFSRNLSFVPKAIVDVTVSFGATLELTEKYKGTETLDFDMLKSKLVSVDNVVSSIVMSRISLLISQITSSYGERPIVTPPSFLRE